MLAFDNSMCVHGMHTVVSGEWHGGPTPGGAMTGSCRSTAGASRAVPQPRVASPPPPSPILLRIALRLNISTHPGPVPKL